MSHHLPPNHLLVPMSLNSRRDPPRSANARCIACTRYANHNKHMDLHGGSDEGFYTPQNYGYLSYPSSWLHQNSGNGKMSPLQTGHFALHMVEWLLSSKNLT